MAVDMMLSSKRAAWLLLISAMSVRVEGLYQQYCSNQNTGANFSPVYSIYNSNGACQQQCQAEYAFAIVQWQNCWCSNYIPAVQDDTSNCDQGCPGYGDESCGNDDTGMFGYIPLTISPSGTLGPTNHPTEPPTSSYSSPSQAPTSSEPPTETTTVQPDAQTSYVSETVVSTVTQPPNTVVSTLTPTPASSSSTPDPSTSIAAPSTSQHSSSSPVPVTSIRIVTVSGARVTQTVTSTPFLDPGSAEQQQEMKRTGLSGGAIAGVVIGTLIGLAGLLLAAFLLWRRKKHQDAEAGGAAGSRPPKRATSVLSRTGLLSRGVRPTSMAENNYDEGYGSVRHSMLFGAAVGAGAEGVNPSSPLGGSQDNISDTRRHSKPLVYDQRLNPSALFANVEANGSRVSMQDTQDYSRPLGIANPDLRASFDSRVTER